MIAIGGVRVAAAIPEHAKETALRRQIAGELTAIRDQFVRSGFHDPMTQEIERWRLQFFEAFSKSHHPDKVLSAYISLLQELLVDPILRVPLDERSVLGSDGNTYGHMSLSLYLSSAPLEIRHRSPLNPDRADPFTTESHLNVIFMVDWLKRHGAQLHSDQVEKLYKELSAKRLLPALPTPRSERIRKIMEKQLQRDKEKKDLLPEFEEKLKLVGKQIAAEVEDAFAPVHKLIRENHEQALGRIEEIKKNDEIRVKLAKEAEEKLKNRFDALAEQNQQLEKQLEALGNDLVTAQRADIQLQISINQARQAIMERQSSGLGGICGALIAIAAGACVSWASGGTLVPSFTAPGAGGKIGLIIPL